MRSIRTLNNAKGQYGDNQLEHKPLIHSEHYATSLSSFPRRYLLLPLRLLELGLLPFPLLFQLIRSPFSNVFRPVITENCFEDLLHHPTTQEVNDHDHCERTFELSSKWHQFQLLVDLRHEFCGTTECYSSHEYNAPVHAFVLSNALPEWPPLVVNSEGRDLLNELQEVDSAVEKRGLKFTFKIDFRAIFLGLKAMHIVGNVYQSGNMDSKLTKNGWDDIPVPNVILRPFLRELFDGLNEILVSGDKQA